MALYSMTGFGSGNALYDGGGLTAEVAAVNRRQLEIRFNLPRELGALEPELRKMVQERLSRGMVSVRIFRSGGAAENVTVNHARLDALTREALALREKFHLTGEISPVALLTLPGVLEDPGDATASDALKTAAAAALAQALDGLNAMRRREGEALRRELAGRLALLRGIATALRGETSGVEEALRGKLTEKIAQLGLGVDVHDERFLKEVLFYADKADVTEELTRLESHFVQFDGFLADAPGGGRSMDFLIQEMFREITTLGNKAGSGKAAPLVVRFKSELEKLREQVQNVE